MKTEKAFTIFFLLGLILKFLHCPGATVLLTISLLAISILYFPAAFYFFCDKIVERQNLLLSLISSTFLSIVPVGILFKIMNWEGGQHILIIGLVAAPMLFVVTCFLRFKKPDYLATYYKNMFWRTSVLTGLTLVFYML